MICVRAKVGADSQMEPLRMVMIRMKKVQAMENTHANKDRVSPLTHKRRQAFSSSPHVHCSHVCALRCFISFLCVYCVVYVCGACVFELPRCFSIWDSPNP